MRSSKALEMTQNQFIDWRGMCEELVEELESAGRGFQITDAAPETLSAWADEAFRAADRARAALAQPKPEAEGPTDDKIPPVPFSEHDLQQQWNQQADEFNQWDSLGSDEQLEWAQARAIAADRSRTALAQPEPEVVGPTDAQLIEEAIAVGLAFQPQDEVEEVFLPFDAEEPLDEVLVAFARTVLARWGRPAPAPDGERQAAPVPVAEGEVAELVIRLRDAGDALRDHTLPGSAAACDSAADLLERQAAPVPVAVSEQQPGAEDCIAEEMCWRYWPPTLDRWATWSLSCGTGTETHWLPAHTLPLPSGEVE